MEKNIEEYNKELSLIIDELDEGNMSHKILEEQLQALFLKHLPTLTPSSLPTDEEIESKLMQSAMTRTDDEFGLDKLEIGFHETIVKWLRTNFSSEKDNENCVLKFIGWLFEKWDKHPDYNDVWIEIYGEEIKTTSELYEIFKQEQQTTK